MTPEEFWKIWEESAPTPRPIFFRLYYNETTGRPIEYSMEDRPGKYIDITPEQYSLHNFRIKVVDNQIVEIPLFVPSKLVPSNHGTPCHINDVSVVVDNSTTHQTWALQDEKD